MTSVQGSKILADVRTDSLHSGPLCPGNQHTSTYTPLTRQPAQHVQMATTTLRRQSLKACAKRAWVERRATDIGHTQGHTDSKIKSWAEVVRFCTSEKTANSHVAIFMESSVPIACSPFSIDLEMSNKAHAVSDSSEPALKAIPIFLQSCETKSRMEKPVFKATP